MMNKDKFIAIIAIVIVILLSTMYGVCYKCSMNKRWNNGICPVCGNKYEQRGISAMTKYYICPYCGHEVER